jgi:hypothetical protein
LRFTGERLWSNTASVTGAPGSVGNGGSDSTD